MRVIGREILSGLWILAPRQDLATRFRGQLIDAFAAERWVTRRDRRRGNLAREPENSRKGESASERCCPEATCRARPHFDEIRRSSASFNARPR